MLRRIAIVVAFSLLVGIDVEARGEMGNDERYSNKENPLHPYNARESLIKSNGLRDDSFVLKLGDSPEEINRIKKKYDNYNSALNETYGLDVAMYPMETTLRSIISVQAHKNFISKVTFPLGYVISQAKASQPLSLLEWDENLLQFKIGKNFEIGNIEVALTNGRENVTVAIVLKKYKAYEKLKLPFYQHVVLRDRDNEKKKYNITDWEVISKYKEEYGSLSFSKYGVLYVNNKPYYIIKDKTNGTIIYKGVNYRISRNLELEG